MSAKASTRANRREAEISGWAWRTFAMTYPHEAYAAWPDRFLKYATKKTGLPAEKIISALRATEGP